MAGFEIEHREHKSQPFGRLHLPCAGEVYTLNVTHGCAYRCAACHQEQPGGAQTTDRRVAVYSGLHEQVSELLDSSRRRLPLPEQVIVGTNSESFADHPAIVLQTQRVLEVLLQRGIAVRLITRGIVPADLVPVLQRHARLLSIGVSIASLQERFAATWEPGLPTPQQRLHSARRLVAAGIATTVRIDPLVPLHNDRDTDLRRLFEALANQGLRKVTALYLRLRPGQTARLESQLPAGTAHFVENLYRPQLLSAAQRQAVPLRLPRPWRVTNYERIGRLAAHYGLQLSICGCHNPDMIPKDGQGDRFRCADQPPRRADDASETRQLPLFSGR